MSEESRIWRGGVGDAAALAALHATTFPDAWPEAAFASLLERAEVAALLGGDASAQGFILVRVVAGEAEVLTFCVAEAARRRGLGRALLEAACAAVTRSGASEMFLEVGERNAAAIALYRRLGFLVVGRRSAYYHHGADASDAIVMRRALNQD